SRTFRFHEGKAAKPPSVKVTFMTGLTAINTWLCPQHTGYAQAKAHRWWHKHGGQRPFPHDVLSWLERQNELFQTAEISVRPDGRYWTVVDERPGTERQFADPEVPEPANDNYSTDGWRNLDEVPF